MKVAISRVTDVTDMATGPVIGVCSQGAGAVVLHSLETGNEIGRIPVGGHPVHSTVVEERVFVATMDERSVSVIDTDGTVARIDIGVLGPSHFAVSAGRLFVSCTAGDVIAAIDPVTCELVKRIAVGAEPHELVANDGLLYVGSRREGTISVIDATDLRTVHEITLDKKARIEGMAIHPQEDRGYAIDRIGERVLAFTLDEGSRILSEAPVGSDPYDLSVDSTGVFVPGRGSGTVHEFGRDLDLRAVHDGFNQPVDLCAVRDDYWAIDRKEPALVSLGGNRLGMPAGAITAQQTDHGILLSHYDDALISLVDPEEGVLWSSPTAANPFGLLVV